MIERLRCECGEDFAGPDTHTAKTDYYQHRANCPDYRGINSLRRHDERQPRRPY